MIDILHGCICILLPALPRFLIILTSIEVALLRALEVNSSGVAPAAQPTPPAPKAKGSGRNGPTV